ncbi:MAG TPA: transcriptional regulator [Dysgonomonas sp.]|nr:transcriptional regulator [Dysgonomonas sp.]
MEEIKDKRKVHHGRNVRIARNWKNLTQEGLATMLDLYQTDISVLEQKETIDDAMLDRIARAMDVPKDFFTDFDMDTTMNSYHVSENEFNMTQAENSKGEIYGQKIIEKEEINNNPGDKVIELYERIIKEKDDKIKDLESKLNNGK